MAITSASPITCDIEAAVEGNEIVTLTTGLKHCYDALWSTFTRAPTKLR